MPSDKKTLQKTAFRENPPLAAGKTAPHFASVGSPYFSIMLAFMAVIVILSNIGGSKGVQIGPITTDGGFFLFPFAYILGDVISEVYGFKVARRAITTTFALSVFASLSYWIIIILPGFTDDFGQAKQAALGAALGPVPQIVLASLLGFLAGQTINSLVMVRLKARQGERRLWVRLMGSSGMGEFVDTVIFCSIAAPVIGITGFGMFANYVVIGFVYKTLVEYLFVPLTAVVIKWIKKREPTYGLPAALPTWAPREPAI
ncbi:queuosine precursor transporter [Arthrobacter sp. H14-L1]|uniref:queuosine precursor transporter n=1 Tax=Arthrobacter sp. H14-L1 TaxID=2996697 RepID=UPI0022716568|nr:queuosine precursor transporter [Arthrobacter sp. H14-L1]MCY0904045.1 queuosine precursor transporter [Arthrobacter sp. H14-L1]